MMFLFGTIFYQLNRLMFPMDLGWFSPSWVASSLLLRQDIFAAQAQLFSAKDNDCCSLFR